MNLEKLIRLITKKEKNKELKYEDLRVNYKSIMRVKIYSAGYFLEEINAGTPIVNKDGIKISIELMFTYINRGLVIELLDTDYLEDIFLLIVFSIEYNKNKNPTLIESKLHAPLEWCLKQLNNKEYEELVKKNNPILALREDPEMSKRLESYEKVEKIKRDLKKRILNNGKKFTTEDKENVLKNIKKKFVGSLLEEKIDKHRGVVRYIPKKNKNTGIENYLNNDEEVFYE